MHYTKQEIFNLSVTGVVNQGGPSRIDDDLDFGCAYRGDDGRKCGIGHLIKDEDYNPVSDKESLSIWSVIEKGFLPEYIPQTTIEEKNFLNDMQEGHDLVLFDDGDVEYYIEHMEELAISNDLTMPVLKSLDD